MNNFTGTDSRCDNCNDVNDGTIAERDNGSTCCAACWADALAYGHMHGLHVDEDGNDAIVDGCPSCAGNVPACYRADAALGDVPVWSAFCEALGTRCTFVDGGVRCDGGVTVGERCAQHQPALRLTDDERRAVEDARRERVDWSALPVRSCACGQRFYVEHAAQTICRDCMGDGGFYPVPGFAAARESSFDVREPAVDVDELPWIVMCRVSGGVTGTRQAPLKGIDGAVKRFASEADARAEADRRTAAIRTSMSYSRASFAYWPQLANEGGR